MTSGYLYCFSNSSFLPNIFKVGMTERTPEQRAKELFTTGVPTPFKIEFAKKVNNYKQKEKTIHKLLTKHLYRINPKREFFRAPLADIKEFFDLMDDVAEDDDDTDDADDDESLVMSEDDYGSPVISGFTESDLLCEVSRNMAECFIDGQKIRHVGTAGTPTTWIGTYCREKDRIVFGDMPPFKTPSQFAAKHYEIERPDRTTAVNGWSECEYEINGEWFSIFNLTKSAVLDGGPPTGFQRQNRRAKAAAAARRTSAVVPVPPVKN